jgi:hypothetical protein
MMTEEKALEILMHLIANPSLTAAQIPETWATLLNIHNAHFAPPVEEPKRKRRKNRRSVDASGNSTKQGWPGGLSHKMYSEWRAVKQSEGVTEGINPRNCLAELQSRGT